MKATEMLQQYLEWIKELFLDVISAWVVIWAASVLLAIIFGVDLT